RARRGGPRSRSCRGGRGGGAQHSSHHRLRDRGVMMPRFADIPTFPRASWCVDVGWDYLERFLDGQLEIGLDLEPDFQRAHVWTREQQIAYVEYQLRGGEVAREITCNAKDWSSGQVHDYVIVDGK